MTRAEPWWRAEFGDYDAIRRETDRLAGRGHLDDVPWFVAPLPEPVHECWVQTWQVHFAGRLWLQRCPCGAWRHHPIGEPAGEPPVWRSVNSRAQKCAPSPSLIMRALRCLRRKDKP